MLEVLACLRRTEPSAALMPRPGQRRLAYVPAATTDIRERLQARQERPPSSQAHRAPHANP